jgi:hypothetical protein
MASAGGTALILIGFLGMGLAANGLVWLIVGLVWLIVLLSGIEIETNLEEMPSVFVIIVGSISAIIIGLLGVVAFSAGVPLRDRGRRLRARDARTLLQRPGEGPVLLLRSFDDEALVDPRPMNLFQRRYEESLSRVLKQLGPVITVGRPGDPVGFAGAARFYVSEDNWQRAIRYLMAHSAAVVIIVGRTQGLWWEIGTAFECVAREHLLFFFPLVGTVPRNPSPIAGFKSFFKRWNAIGYKEMEIEHRARYQLFRQRSAQYLRQSLPVELKNAFFLDFLPDGQARVLQSRYGLLEYLWGVGLTFSRDFAGLDST